MDLRPEEKAYIAELIAAGRYATADEVIGMAFKVLRLAEEELAAFWDSCEQGSAKIEAGGGIDGETLIKDLRREIHITAEVQRRMAEEAAESGAAHTT